MKKQTILVGFVTAAFILVGAGTSFAGDRRSHRPVNHWKGKHFTSHKYAGHWKRGRIGMDTGKHHVTDGTTAASTRVPAIALIRIRPGADGARNLLSATAPGSMGIVPRLPGTVIAIRRARLLTDNVGAVGTVGTRVIRPVCVRDEGKAIGAMLPPTLRMTLALAEATGMRRAGSSCIEARG